MFLSTTSVVLFCTFAFCENGLALEISCTYPPTHIFTNWQIQDRPVKSDNEHLLYRSCFKKKIGVVLAGLTS